MRKLWKPARGKKLKPEIELGYYRHFRGALYQVFGLVRNSETKEWLVSYGITKPEWVRPPDLFNSTVEIDGEEKSRFEYLGKESPILSGDLFNPKEF